MTPIHPHEPRSELRIPANAVERSEKKSIKIINKRTEIDYVDLCLNIIDFRFLSHRISESGGV